MTEWWSIPPQGTEDEAQPETPVRDIEPGFSAAPASAGETVESGVRPRRKVKQIAVGMAGAVVVGILAINAVSDGSGNPKGSAPVSTEWVQGVSVAKEGLPAAGGGPAEASQDTPSVAPAKKEVTITATAAGKGRVGAVMAVSVHNGTDRPVMVLSSLMKGDDHPAVVGEGTLAPGSRVIAPGDTAEGTVEFSAGSAPSRIVLVDLKGNVIAKESGDATLDHGGSTG